MNNIKNTEKKKVGNQIIETITKNVFKILFSNKFKNFLKDIIVEVLQEHQPTINNNMVSLSEGNPISPTISKNKRAYDIVAGSINQSKNNKFKDILMDTLKENMGNPNPLLMEKTPMVDSMTPMSGMNTEGIQFLPTVDSNSADGPLVSGIDDEGRPEINVDAFMQQVINRNKNRGL